MVASSTFNLPPSVAAQSVKLELNYTFLDAGTEVIVNGISFFNTGDDVSNFRPPGTAFMEDLINPFDQNGNMNGIPRITVISDSTGTTFTGSITTTATSASPLTPTFSVSNFTSLLQTGTNTIQILNLNNFQGNGLGGDFLVTAHQIPEPSTTVLFILSLGGALTFRRRLTL